MTASQTCRAGAGPVSLHGMFFFVILGVLLQCRMVASSTTGEQQIVGTTSYTCSNASGIVRASVVLKPGGTPLQLSCASKENLVPQGLTGQSEAGVSPKVCKATEDSLTDCQNPLSLSELIPGATSGWTEEIANGARLTIPGDKFPLTEQKFAVGCVNTKVVGEQANSAYGCMVTVTVEPRAATVVDNVVTCSYGSKEANAPVSLTPSTRSFKLVCGANNKLQPVQYTMQFCSGSTVKNCTPKSYNELFTGYEEGWWSTPGGTNMESTAKFEIPPDRFPSEKKIFLVGCEAPSSAAAQPFYCNVPVTVDPQKANEDGGGASASIRTDAKVILLGISAVVAGCFFSF